MILEVKPTDPKQWGLFVNGILLGTSRNRFDADHGRAILENAIDRVSKGLDAPTIPDATGHSSEPEECGEFAGHFIAGASWFACALPKGHEGSHQRGGNCFAHGKYIGDRCPEWPKCIEALAQKQIRSLSEQMQNQLEPLP